MMAMWKSQITAGSVWCFLRKGRFFSAYSPRLKIEPVDKLFPHILKVLDMLCSYDLTPFNANRTLAQHSDILTLLLELPE